MKSTFNIPSVTFVERAKLEPNTTYLSLISVATVPPHISLICNGCYFSYSVFGVKLGSDAISRVLSFEKKALANVYIDLGAYFSLDEVTAQYQSVANLAANSSCMAPILALFASKGLRFPVENFYVFDLIALLQDQNTITKVIAVNCLPYKKKEALVLPTYNQQSINTQIEKVLLNKR